MDSAMRAMKLMRHERPQGATVSQADMVWTVKGCDTVRRKVSEITSEVKKSVLMVEAYPPLLIRSVRAPLKSSQNKGIEVMALAPVTKEPEFVQHRRLKLSSQPSDLGGSDDGVHPRNAVGVLRSHGCG